MLAENKCIENSKCFYDLLNICPFCIAIINKNLILEFINKELENVLGYKLEELRDMHLETITNKFFISDINLFAITSLCEFDNLFSSLESDKDVIISLVNRHRENIILSVKLYNIDNENILLALFNNNNIYEFEKNKMQTSHIFNSVNNFVVVADKNNKIISCNRLFYEITGVKPNNAIGLPIKVLCKYLQLSFVNTASIKKKYINAHFRTREVTISNTNGEKSISYFKYLPLKMQIVKITVT